MNHASLCAGALLALAALTPCQEPPRTTIQSALAEARQLGQVRDEPAEVLAWKRAFRESRNKDRRGIAEWRRLHPQLPAPRPEIDALVPEFEFNDSWRWADALQNQTVARGDNATRRDLDCFSYVATGNAFVHFSVQQRGAAPIDDATLTIRTEYGDPVAFLDVPGNESFGLYLPAGTYCIEVGSWLDPTGIGPLHGGAYDLVVGTDPLVTGAPQPLGSAGASGTTRRPGTGAHDVFTFTVPEGTLNVALTGGDTVLYLQRSDGAVMFMNDDSSFGLSSALDIDLPAGTYFLYVVDFAAVGGLQYTASFAHTQHALPDLATLPSVPGTVQGDESFRLYRLTLPADQGVDLMTSAGPWPAVGDTILALYDQQLGYLCDVDDDQSGVPPRGYYSRIRASLFQGSYLVGVAPYPGRSGSFTLATTTGLPFAPAGTIGLGTSALQIANQGQVNSYLLDSPGGASVRLRASWYFCNVIGPGGTLGGTLPGQDYYAQAIELRRGRSMVLAWDRFGWPGSVALDLLPTLDVEQNQLVARGKEGDLVFLFADFATGPGVNFGIGDRGWFCLNYPSAWLVTVGFQVVGPTGRTLWMNVPPTPVGVWFQQADLHTNLNWSPGYFGTWRNLRGL